MGMNVEEFRQAAYTAIDIICDYQQSLDQLPVVAQVEPGYLGKVLPKEAPEKGESFDVIVRDYQRHIVPGLTHWQHPSFFGYFPAANTFESVLADMLSSSVTNPGFNWACSPACTELEMIVMDWAAKLLGLDHTFYIESKSGGGVIQTAASESALIAIVAARMRYSRVHPNVPLNQQVIYGTSQTHSLGAKAALILGLQFRAIEVYAKDNYALRGDSLIKALEEDHKAGKHPFVIIATVGTTSSGAIDNIQEIGQALSNYPDLWLHIDAAWAGLALACPEFREMAYLDAINKYAHSFCTSFHKWGLVNLDCSALWARERTLLTDALDVTPEFLRTKHADNATVFEYRNWHLAVGRRFRSLKVWFVLRSFGIEGFQAHIRKGVELARFFESLMAQTPMFEIVTPRSFGLVVFRLRLPTVTLFTPVTIIHSEESPASCKVVLANGASSRTTAIQAHPSVLLAQCKHSPAQSDANALNRAFYARISARENILLTQTDLVGTFCIRMAIGAVRTEEKHVQEAFDLLVEEAQATLREWKGK